MYSATTQVFYFKNSEIVIYPNPVVQDHAITIQMSALQNQQIKITDIAGRVVYNAVTNSTIEKIQVSFAKGLYFITINNPETNNLAIFKLLVQ